MVLDEQRSDLTVRSNFLLIVQPSQHIPYRINHAASVSDVSQTWLKWVWGRELLIPRLCRHGKRHGGVTVHEERQFSRPPRRHSLSIIISDNMLGLGSRRRNSRGERCRTDACLLVWIPKFLTQPQLDRPSASLSADCWCYLYFMYEEYESENRSAAAPFGSCNGGGQCVAKTSRFLFGQPVRVPDACRVREHHTTSMLT